MAVGNSGICYVGALGEHTPPPIIQPNEMAFTCLGLCIVCRSRIHAQERRHFGSGQSQCQSRDTQKKPPGVMLPASAVYGHRSEGFDPR